MSISIPFKDRNHAKKKSLPNPKRFLKRGQGRWGRVEKKITKAGDSPPPATKKHTLEFVISNTEKSISEDAPQVKNKSVSFHKETIQSKIKNQILRSRRSRKKNPENKEIEIHFKPPPKEIEVPHKHLQQPNSEISTPEVVEVESEVVNELYEEENPFDFDDQLEVFQRQEDEERFANPNFPIEQNEASNNPRMAPVQQVDDELDELFQGDDLLDELDQHLEPDIFQDETSWMKTGDNPQPLVGFENQNLNQSPPELDNYEQEIEHIDQQDEINSGTEPKKNEMVEEYDFRDDPLLKDISVEGIPDALGSFADDSGSMDQNKRATELSYDDEDQPQEEITVEDDDDDTNISPLSKRCFIPTYSEPRNILRQSTQLVDEELFVEEEPSPTQSSQSHEQFDPPPETDEAEEIEEIEEKADNPHPAAPRGKLIQKYFFNENNNKNNKKKKNKNRVQRRLQLRKERLEEEKTRTKQTSELEAELQHFRVENERLLSARTRLSIEKQRLTHESTELRRKYELKVKDFDLMKEKEWRRIEREKKVLGKQARLRVRAGRVDGLEREIEKLKKQVEDERRKSGKRVRSLKSEVERWKKKAKDLGRENGELREKVKSAEMRRIDHEFSSKKKNWKKKKVREDHQQEQEQIEEEDERLGHDDFIFEEESEDEGEEGSGSTAEDYQNKENENPGRKMKARSKLRKKNDSLLLSHMESVRREYLPKNGIDKRDGVHGGKNEEAERHSDQIKRRTELANGKVQIEYLDGLKEIIYPNNTVKKVWPGRPGTGRAGQGGPRLDSCVSVYFNNGDVKKRYGDGKVVYYYDSARTTHVTFSNGLEVFYFPNRQIENHYPDGSKEIEFPDKTRKFIDPKGREEIIFADGSVQRL